MLTRETGWRQGDLLTQDAAAKLTAPNCVVGEDHRVVVITHDCDIPHDGETSVTASRTLRQKSRSMPAKRSPTRPLRWPTSGAWIRGARNTSACEMMIAGTSCR